MSWASRVKKQYHTYCLNDTIYKDTLEMLQADPNREKDHLEHLAELVQKKYPTDNNDKDSLLILSCGGTFGSFLNDASQLAPAANRLGPLVKKVLQEQQFTWRFMELETPIDSTESTLSHWNVLALILYVLVEKGPFSCAVVIHGTDTLADVSSGLSFMLWNSRKLIVVTGSQKPLAREIEGPDEVNEDSDAIRNLRFAVSVCLVKRQHQLRGVYSAFHGKLMVGTRVVKRHSYEEDAFHSPNQVELFRKLEKGSACDLWGKLPEKPFQVGCFGSKEWWGVRESYVSDLNQRSYKRNEKYLAGVHFIDPTLLVAIVPLFPSMWSQHAWKKKTQDEKNAFVKNHWGDHKAIIIEAYGAGNIPTHINEMLEIAHSLQIRIAMITKCMMGTTNPELYAVGAGSNKNEIKVANLSDCTSHAAYAKVLCHLSKHPDGDQEKFCEHIQDKNFRGEKATNNI